MKTFSPCHCFIIFSGIFLITCSCKLSVGFEIMFYRYAFKTENLSLIDTRTGSAAAEKQRQTRARFIIIISLLYFASAGMICPNIITGQTLSLDRDIFVQSWSRQTWKYKDTTTLIHHEVEPLLHDLLCMRPGITRERPWTCLSNLTFSVIAIANKGQTSYMLSINLKL